MPLPRSVAHFNKRYTNRIFARLLRRTAGFATIEHVGRTTGTIYRTPLYAFTDDSGALLVSLTYGPSADWAQNVLAGDAAVTWCGATRPIESAQFVNRHAAWPHLPRLVRVALQVLNVHDFMQLTYTPTPAVSPGSGMTPREESRSGARDELCD